MKAPGDITNVEEDLGEITTVEAQRDVTPVEEAVGDITKVRAPGDITTPVESSSTLVSLCSFINDECLL